jgi:hypothetical protein
MLMREVRFLRTSWLLLVWVALLLSPSGLPWAGESAPADSAPSISLRKGAPVCAPQTMAFLTIFRAPDNALARIFSGHDDRVVSMEAKRFTVPYVRGVLASLGQTTQDSLTLVHAMVRFSGDAKPSTYRTTHGDGYVVQTERLDGKNRVTVCEAGLPPALRARADEILRSGDLLLARITIDAQPYAMAVYSPFYQPDSLAKDEGPAQAVFLATVTGRGGKGVWLSLQRDSLATASCRTN